MDHLSVDADQAYNISRAVGNDAQELREELEGLQRDWDNLSREWSGAASYAYSAIWCEWLEGATTLVDALASRRTTWASRRCPTPSRTPVRPQPSARHRLT